ncbi:MAG TPA: class I SAM-dependent methyltransferase [Kofleriaceae bacterium]|jgi:SAM-dependent methyltransferase
MKLVIAIVSSWLVPLLALAWLGHPVPPALLAIAAGIALVHGGLLAAGFLYTLRLRPGALRRAALVGAVTGLAGAAWLPLGCAAISGAASGVAIAAYLCLDAGAHWYPRAPATRRPTHAWYWGRALYVSRRDYARIFVAVLTAGVPLAVLGLVVWRPLLDVAAIGALAGVALLAYSIFGLYRMYGPPSMRYFERLLAGVRDGAVIADLHIGTYRTAFALADLRPRATIHSIDCGTTDGSEAAVADVRDLEPAPIGCARIDTATTTSSLADGSCDAVVFGFGTHEIPTGGPREALFAEARRVLRPGGVALLFEHGYDLHNYVIFGPVIDHVTRRADWLATMRRYFADVTIARSSAAVDLLAGVRDA